jgi:hypothetical protein
MLPLNDKPGKTTYQYFSLKFFVIISPAGNLPHGCGSAFFPKPSMVLSACKRNITFY